MSYQMPLLEEAPTRERVEYSHYEDIGSRLALGQLLESNLDFHEGESTRLTHALHAFPAKFPPELPRFFIQHLTNPGDVVLDPMMGSGTTLLEASVAGCKPIGNDIDSLALRIAKVKVTKCDYRLLLHSIDRVVTGANRDLRDLSAELTSEIHARFDEKTQAFVNYWFAFSTQLELQALSRNIALEEMVNIRSFLEVAFSSIIITKNGGVSLALDLAHSRPHRAKKVVAQDGSLVIEDALIEPNSPRLAILTKRLRNAVEDFRKRALRNAQFSQSLPEHLGEAKVLLGDAKKLDLDDESIDLVFTSPPYASNAIDYMRVNKFALVWFGGSVTELSTKRNEYIGGEAASRMELASLPKLSQRIVDEVAALDKKRSLALHRYYTEMGEALLEMKRVTKKGKAIILVVGNSTMRGIDTQTAECLGEIGVGIGLQLVGIGVRNLDRGRRMLPSAAQRNAESTIEQRMHQEYVIGFVKP